MTGDRLDNTNHAFGSYADIEQVAAAVDALIGAGFNARAITVMHHENEISLAFAQRKGTRPPAGTDRGTTAEVPLEGSLGLLYPGEGPVAGALDGALTAMGVPLDWPHGVSEGKVLLSVECPNAEAVAQGLAVLVGTGAMETGSAVGTAA